MESSTLKWRGKAQGIVIFLLFLFSFNLSYSQTIHITNSVPNSMIYTNWDFQGGFNYYHSKFGESARLMYDVRSPFKIGITLDYLNGQFYQSSGNASISYKINTKLGELEGYAITGTGLEFNNSYKPIGIIGVGLSYQSLFNFKIRRLPVYIEIGGEIDEYSSLPFPVFKQFFGFRLRF